MIIRYLSCLEKAWVGREMRIRSFSSQSSAINLANSDPQSNSKKDLAYNYSYFNQIPVRQLNLILNHVF